MTASQPLPQPVGAPASRGRSTWTTGLARFAGAVMILLGVLDIVVGTDRLFGSGVTVVGVRHAFSVSGGVWGSILIVVGALVGLAGMAVIAGQLWGRMIGIVLVCLSLGVGFFALSHHPVGLVLALALGIIVIWALCVFDEEASAASPTMLD